jgi:hypothetical protein
MVNVHIHNFDPHGAVLDAGALEVFQAQWTIYQKLVDSDVLSHGAVGGILHDAVSGHFARPFTFLDIACGDSSLAKSALAGTKVRHYHGIDLAAPALDLAARNLAGEPYEVDLDQRDFVDAITDRAEHADAAWCGLSLHHLATADKLRVMRALRGIVGEDGVFMLYEPTLGRGEDRQAYLDRTWQIIPERWSSLTPAELDSLWRHIQTSDLPESSHDWIELGREAGFSSARELFIDPSGLYRMFRYDA